jgi:hypothetical protein
MKNNTNHTSSVVSWSAQSMPSSLEKMIDIVGQCLPQSKFGEIALSIQEGRFSLFMGDEILSDGSKEFISSPDVVSLHGFIYLSWSGRCLPERFSFLLTQVHLYYPVDNFSRIKPILDRGSFVLRA